MKTTGRLKITPLGQLTEPQLKSMETGLLSAALDIDRLAKIYAPIDKGNLVNSGRVAKVKDGYAIVFGGSDGGFNVPYAAIRHEVNKKNPGKRQYLKRAGDQVSKQQEKYFRNK